MLFRGSRNSEKDQREGQQEAAKLAALAQLEQVVEESCLLAAQVRDQDMTSVPVDAPLYYAGRMEFSHDLHRHIRRLGMMADELQQFAERSREGVERDFIDFNHAPAVVVACNRAIATMQDMQEQLRSSIAAAAEHMTGFQLAIDNGLLEDDDNAPSVAIKQAIAEIKDLNTQAVANDGTLEDRVSNIPIYAYRLLQDQIEQQRKDLRSLQSIMAEGCEQAKYVSYLHSDELMSTPLIKQEILQGEHPELESLSMNEAVERIRTRNGAYSLPAERDAFHLLQPLRSAIDAYKEAAQQLTRITDPIGCLDFVPEDQDLQEDQPEA